MSETRQVGRRNVPGVKVKGPKNAKGVLKRLLAFIFKNYLPHCILVLVCIIGAALAQVRGTLFLQTLIDDYITPMDWFTGPGFWPACGCSVADRRGLCIWYSLLLLIHPRDGQCLAGNAAKSACGIVFPHGAAAHPLF